MPSSPVSPRRRAPRATSLVSTSPSSSRRSRLASQKAPTGGSASRRLQAWSARSTTKEMAAAVFFDEVSDRQDPGNLNSGIGFPMAVLNLEEAARGGGGAEFGKSSRGRDLGRFPACSGPIRRRSRNVSAAHWRSPLPIDEIADAKWEIESRASRRTETPRLQCRRRAACSPAKNFSGKKISFGASGADVSALGVEAAGLGEVSSSNLSMSGETERVRLSATGRHQVSNFLCAAGMALAWGFSTASEVAGAAKRILGSGAPRARRRSFHRAPC